MTVADGANGRGASLGVLWRHRRPLGLALILVLVGAAAGLAQPLMAADIIDAVRQRQPWTASVALLVCLFGVQIVVDTGGRYVLERAGERVVLDLRTRLVDRLLRLATPAYDRQRLGDLISRVTHDSGVFHDLAARGVVDIVVGVVTAVGATALMVSIDPLLFVMVAVIFGIAAAGVSFGLGGVQAASQARQTAVGGLAAELERALSAIRTIRVGRAEHRETERLLRLAGVAYEAGLRTARLTAAVVPAVHFAATGSFLLVLVVGGTRVADGALGLGGLIAVLLYATYLVVPLGSLVEGMTVVSRANGAYQRIIEVLALPLESPDITPADVHGDPGAAAVVRLNDVSFRYEDREILRGVDLRVDRGSRIALVGPSGAGKSTILSLICRLYEPTGGRIEFLGRRAEHLDRADCRRLIGLVEQDSPILFGSVRDNLTLTAPDACDDDIRHALELVNLWPLVNRLPDGLDTAVGEHGRWLSGGERQRLALARALLTRPALLLLDEPTANLDADNEQQVLAAIDALPATCAVLTVSHRLSTIQRAERVLLLVDGAVEASGTHEELLDVSATYRRLVLLGTPGTRPEQERMTIDG